MKFYEVLRSWGFVCLFIFLAGCGGGYDHDLEEPDGFGGGYNLTPLGNLVWGPFHVSDSAYNKKLFLNDSEMSSKAALYSNVQRDLVFQLYKNGTLTYWLQSEIGSTEDTTNHEGTVTITPRPPEGEQLKKVYSDGYWKVNFKDSNIVVHFGRKALPEFRYKFVQLGTLTCFTQSYFVDSIYKGKKEKIKIVNSFYYEMIYPTF